MPQRPEAVQSQLPAAQHQKAANFPEPLGFSGVGAGKSGKVTLVGAGPGDPGLLTLRGLQCLQRADVVLFDGLANPQLLEFAPQAEHLSVGKHGQIPHWSQADINARLIALAQEGKHVVRLKGGDPAVFARTAEELEVLAASGVEFEVVPGITAALAAASYVGIPITHRQHASAVAFVTGQQQNDATPQEIDWSSLARFPGTLVFYMGVTTVQQWTSQLMLAGKSGDTPTAIIRRCTWEDQHVIRCKLQEVSQHLTPASKLRPPVIVIVGAVAALGEDFNWFEKRPLHGCGVLVTRPEQQSRDLEQSLRELGARVYFEPVIQLAPPQDSSGLQLAIATLVTSHERHGITFSSRSGVEHFMQALFASGHDVRALANTCLAGVGPSIAEALQGYGLKVDVLPDGSQGYSALALLDELRRVADRTQVDHWLVTTCNHSRSTLVDGLRELGHRVTDVLTYESHPVAQLKETTRKALAEGQIQYCTVTSSLTADATYDLLGEFCASVEPVSFSPKISERLKQLGWPPHEEAATQTTSALVDAIVLACQAKGKP